MQAPGREQDRRAARARRQVSPIRACETARAGTASKRQIGGSGVVSLCWVLSSSGSCHLLRPPSLPPRLHGTPLEYFADALQILRAAGPPRVPAAVTGISRGSEAALLTAIQAPEAVQGVVATVPANVIAGSRPPGGPAWLRNGHPLPCAGHQRPDDENPGALIPGERVCGPVPLIAAGADQAWPSAQMARALSARLRQHGDPHGHALLDYPRAGHSLGSLIPQPVIRSYSPAHGPGTARDGDISEPRATATVSGHYATREPVRTRTPCRLRSAPEVIPRRIFRLGALTVWPELQPAAQQLAESIVGGVLNGKVWAES